MDSEDLEDLHHDQAIRDVFIDKLTGWKCRTNIEKKLVLGVLHRRGHKDFKFEEDRSQNLDNNNDSDKSYSSIS